MASTKDPAKKYFDPTRGLDDDVEYESPIAKNLLSSNKEPSDVYKTPGQFVLNGIPFEGTWHWQGESGKGSAPQSISITEENYLSHFSGLRGGEGVSINTGQSRSVISISAIFEKERVPTTLEPILASLKRFPLCIIDNELLRRGLPVFPHEPIGAFIQQVNANTIPGFAGAIQLSLQLIWFNHRPFTTELKFREKWLTNGVIIARGIYEAIGREEFIRKFGHPADVFAALGEPSTRDHGGLIHKAGPFLNYIFGGKNVRANSLSESDIVEQTFKKDPYTLGTTRLLFPIFRQPIATNLESGAEEKINVISYVRKLGKRARQGTDNVLIEAHNSFSKEGDLYLGPAFRVKAALPSSQQPGTLAEKIGRLAKQMSREYGVPLSIVNGIMKKKSANLPGMTGFRIEKGRTTFAGRSSASGLMQLEARTYKEQMAAYHGASPVPEDTKWVGPHLVKQLKAATGKTERELRDLSGQRFNLIEPDVEMRQGTHPDWNAWFDAKKAGTHQFNLENNLRAGISYLRKMQVSSGEPTSRTAQGQPAVNWRRVAQWAHLGPRNARILEAGQKKKKLGLPPTSKVRRLEEKSEKFITDLDAVIGRNAYVFPEQESAPQVPRTEDAPLGADWGLEFLEVKAMAGGHLVEIKKNQDQLGENYVDVTVRTYNRDKSDSWLIVYTGIQRATLPAIPELNSADLTGDPVYSYREGGAEKPISIKQGQLLGTFGSKLPMLDPPGSIPPPYPEAFLFKMSRARESYDVATSVKMIVEGRSLFRSEGPHKGEGEGTTLQGRDLPTPQDALRMVLEFSGSTVDDATSKARLLSIAKKVIEDKNSALTGEVRGVIRTLKEIMEEGWIWLQHPISHKYVMFRIESLPLPDFDWLEVHGGSTPVGVTNSIAFGFSHSLAVTPLSGHRFPTVQYMGGSRTNAAISMRIAGDPQTPGALSNRRGFLDVLRTLCNNYLGATIQYREFTRDLPIGIVNPLLNLFGIDDVMISGIETSTVGGSPTALDITLRLIAQNERTETHSGKLIPNKGASYNNFLGEILATMIQEKLFFLNKQGKAPQLLHYIVPSLVVRGTGWRPMQRPHSGPGMGSTAGAIHRPGRFTPDVGGGLAINFGPSLHARTQKEAFDLLRQGGTSPVVAHRTVGVVPGIALPPGMWDDSEKRAFVSWLRRHLEGLRATREAAYSEALQSRQANIDSNLSTEAKEVAFAESRAATLKEFRIKLDNSPMQINIPTWGYQVSPQVSDKLRIASASAAKSLQSTVRESLPVHPVGVLAYMPVRFLLEADKKWEDLPEIDKNRIRRGGVMAGTLNRVYLLVNEAANIFEAHINKLNTQFQKEMTPSESLEMIDKLELQPLRGGRLVTVGSARSLDNKTSMRFGNFLALYTNFFGKPLMSVFNVGRSEGRDLVQIAKVLSLPHPKTGKVTSQGLKKLFDNFSVEHAYDAEGLETPTYRDLDLPPNPISGLKIDTNPNCFFWDKNYIRALHPENLEMLGLDPATHTLEVLADKVIAGKNPRGGMAERNARLQSMLKRLSGGAQLPGGGLVYDSSGALTHPEEKDSEEGVRAGAGFRSKPPEKEAKKDQHGRQPRRLQTLRSPRRESSPNAFGRGHLGGPQPDYSAQNNYISSDNQAALVDTAAKATDDNEELRKGPKKGQERDYKKWVNFSLHNSPYKNIALEIQPKRVTPNTIRQTFNISEYEKLQKQAILNSNSLKTSLNNCFPTFQLLFVDEDSESPYHTTVFDDFYTVNSLISIHIVERKDMPGAVCTLELLDLDGLLYNKNFELTDDEWEKVRDRTGPIDTQGKPVRKDVTKDAIANPFHSTMIKDGMKVMVRIGFSNDPTALRTIFVGQIASFSGSHILKIVCQSYGSELVAQEFGTEPAETVDYYNTTTGDIIHDVLDREEVRHFGRWELADTELFGGLFGHDEMRPDGKTKRVWTMTPGVVDDNVFIPEFASYADLWDRGMGNVEYVYWNTTVWAVLKEMELRHPGHIAYPVPFGDRMTLFFGMPDQLYLTKPAHTKSEKLNELLGNPVDQYRTISDMVEWGGGVGAAPSTMTGTEPSKVRAYLTSLHRLAVEASKGGSGGLDLNHPNNKYTAAMMRAPLRSGTVGLAMKIPELGQNEITLRLAISEAREKWKLLNDKGIQMGKRLGKLRRLKSGVWETDTEVELSDILKITNLHQKDRIRSFRNYVLATDVKNIIQNNIRTDKTGTFNSIELRYSSGGVDMGDFQVDNNVSTITANADDSIKQFHLRREIQAWPNANTTELAERYAAQLLANSVKRLYKGNLLMLGDSQVKPYDIIFLSDTYSDMGGPVEVEEVVHSFTRETGYTTDIVPNMIVTVSEDVTQLLSDSVAQVFTEILGEDLKDFMLGMAMGAVPAVGIPLIGHGLHAGRATLGWGVQFGGELTAGAATMVGKSEALKALGAGAARRLRKSKFGKKVLEKGGDLAKRGKEASARHNAAQMRRELDLVKAEWDAARYEAGRMTGLERSSYKAAQEIEEEIGRYIKYGKRAGYTGYGVASTAVGEPSKDRSVWRSLALQSAGTAAMMAFPVYAAPAAIIAGWAIYKLACYNSLRQPLIITPLIKSGKPYIIGLEGFENDTLMINTEKRWQWFNEDIDAGLEVIDAAFDNFFD